jgi:hypothetical protein
MTWPGGGWTGPVLVAHNPAFTGDVILTLPEPAFTGTRVRDGAVDITVPMALMRWIIEQADAT